MKKILLPILLFSLVASAKEIEHYHQKEMHTKVNLNIEYVNFHDSLVKESGNVYGIEIDHKQNAHHLQLYYEKTKISTIPANLDDLDIDKFTLKYGYSFNPQNELLGSYIKINDNLVQQTGHGDVIGAGYRFKQLTFTQYASLYKDFEVYQSDLKALYRNRGTFPFMLVAVGKFIHLSDKNSNDFSKNADTDYFTVGVKLHTHYKQFHFGAATFQGKRIFAVMHDGMRVQHHAMEFKQTYVIAFGYEPSEKLSFTLRYEHHAATEINPYDNDVTIDNAAIECAYSF